ncbi:MAG: hypothetical protein H6835_15185 [Planctomycetes bacterium]|nr:hypothetical protein [Planctomycetota bacterium]
MTIAFSTNLLSVTFPGRGRRPAVTAQRQHDGRPDEAAFERLRAAWTAANPDRRSRCA